MNFVKSVPVEFVAGRGHRKCSLGTSLPSGFFSITMNLVTYNICSILLLSGVTVT